MAAADVLHGDHGRFSGGLPPVVATYRSSPALEASLRAMVSESLQLCIFPNAVFLAERLHSEFPGNANLYTLAQCYMASGDNGTAYRLLNCHYPFPSDSVGLHGSPPFHHGHHGQQPHGSPSSTGEAHVTTQWRCAYLYGVACALTHRYAEAERVMRELEKQGAHAAVSYWLGLCGRRLQRPFSSEHFVKAVHTNPALFAAYENSVMHFNDFEVNPYRELAQHGAAAACGPSFHHQQRQLLPGQQQHQHQHQHQQHATAPSAFAAAAAPGATMQPVPLGGRLSAGTTSTPPQSPAHLSGASGSPAQFGSYGEDHLSASMRQQQQRARGPTSAPATPGALAGGAVPPAAAAGPKVSPVPVPRTQPSSSPARPFGSAGAPPPPPSNAHNATGLQQQQHYQQHQRQHQPSLGACPAHHPCEHTAVYSPAGIPRDAGFYDAAALLRCFADAFKSLYAYRCRDAIAQLTSPDMPHRQTGWVLGHLALAHFHNGDMQQCVQVFQTMRDREPWRLNDRALVYYSTALWHLRDEPGVAHLAQTMVEAMPESSVTMCVVGNAYSAAKDSKHALAMFTRATQVDATHAYAQTLRGYECLALEQRSEAEQAFCEAIRHDARHYNAYSGLGELNVRKESDDRARQYFSRAMEINPLPALLNRFAMTFHRDGASTEDLQRALHYYEAAIERAPTNFTAQHQRASVLMRLRRFPEALELLTRLKTQCPEEAMVFITMAQCLQRCGMVPQAVQCFHRAMDLEPRRTPYIKSCLEALTREGVARSDATEDD